MDGNQFPPNGKTRHWRQTVRWKKDHQARGMFGQVYAGQVETLRLPVFIHPCVVCGTAHAPFGFRNVWYCREHKPE